MYELFFKVGNRTTCYVFKDLPECARKILYLCTLSHKLGIPYDWDVTHTDQNGNANYVIIWRIFDCLVSE